MGKTHLLVAAYPEAPSPKAFLTFEELTYTLGLLGLREGARRFSGLRYLFLDEFELDDPGNAQMVTHFLALTMDRGLRVATTSNTPPGALGEGRFNAEQFRHQIQSLARRFAVERIEGEDFRHRDPDRLPDPLPEERLLALYREDPRPKSLDDFPELIAHLRRLHPIRYRYLFDGLKAVYLRGLEPSTTRTTPSASSTSWTSSTTWAWTSRPPGPPEGPLSRKLPSRGLRQEVRPGPFPARRALG